MNGQISAQMLESKSESVDKEEDQDHDNDEHLVFGECEYLWDAIRRFKKLRDDAEVAVEAAAKRIILKNFALLAPFATKEQIDIVGPVLDFCASKTRFHGDVTILIDGGRVALSWYGCGFGREAEAAVFDEPQHSVDFEPEHGNIYYWPAHGWVLGRGRQTPAPGKLPLMLERLEKHKVAVTQVCEDLRSLLIEFTSQPVDTYNQYRAKKKQASEKK